MYDESIPGERWLAVVGWEGYYEVSDHGRVRSVARTVRKGNGVRRPRPRVLKQQMNRNGYPMIQMVRTGQRKAVHPHRLVAIAFLPRPEWATEVNHKNGVKIDNRAENLEWSNRSKNSIHAAHELGSFNGGKPTGINDFTIRVIRRGYWMGVQYRFMASLFGVSPGTIDSIVFGRDRYAQQP